MRRCVTDLILLIAILGGSLQSAVFAQSVGGAALPLPLKQSSLEKLDARLAHASQTWSNASRGIVTAQSVESILANLARQASLPALTDRAEVWITYDRNNSVDEDALRRLGVQKDDHYRVPGYPFNRT